MSKKLCSPIETDSSDLVSTSLSVRSENTAQHSTWFRTREQNSKEPNKNFAEDLLSVCNYFVAKTTEDEPLPMLEIDKKGVLKTFNMSSTSTQRKITKALGNCVLTRKVKLNVRTEDDRIWLNKALANARWNYNTKRKRFELEKVSPLQDSQQGLRCNSQSLVAQTWL